MLHGQRVGNTTRLFTYLIVVAVSAHTQLGSLGVATQHQAVATNGNYLTDGEHTRQTAGVDRHFQAGVVVFETLNDKVLVHVTGPVVGDDAAPHHNVFFGIDGVDGEETLFRIEILDKLFDGHRLTRS